MSDRHQDQRDRDPDRNPDSQRNVTTAVDPRPPIFRPRQCQENLQTEYLKRKKAAPGLLRERLSLSSDPCTAECGDRLSSGFTVDGEATRGLECADGSVGFGPDLSIDYSARETLPGKRRL